MIKVSLEIEGEAENRLKMLCKSTNSKVTSVIRNALAVYNLLHDESKLGRKVMILDPKTEMEKEVDLSVFKPQK